MGFFKHFIFPTSGRYLQTSALKHALLPILCCFSAIFTLLASNHEPAIILGAVFLLTVISKSRKWCFRGTYLKSFPGEHGPGPPWGLAPLMLMGEAMLLLKSPFFSLTGLEFLNIHLSRILNIFNVKVIYKM